MEKNVPTLRFPGFKGEWKISTLGKITQRISDSVIIVNDNTYHQIGIRSHGKGIFYKEPVIGKQLGNKRVFWVRENALIVNIVFAWEQAVARTTVNELGMIASHRFPMYLPIDNISYLEYLLHFFLTPKGKILLELASPGGAGRNKTLGQKAFENLKFEIPTFEEQTKIANFLTTVDDKITQLKKKKELLVQYKKGVMQKIFNQELRFKDENGEDFAEWEEKKLGGICLIIMGQSPSSNSYNTDTIGIPLIQGNADIQNRLSFPRNWTTEITKECKIGDLILTVRAPVGAVAKSIHNACIGRGVCAIRNNSNSNLEFIYQFLLDFETKWSSLEQGSTFTAVSGGEINKVKIKLPSLPEQTKIANFLSAIDDKISHCGVQIEKMEVWKKGLLQQMFV